MRIQREGLPLAGALPSLLTLIDRVLLSFSDFVADETTIVKKTISKGAALLFKPEGGATYLKSEQLLPFGVGRRNYCPIKNSFQGRQHPSKQKTFV